MRNGFATISQINYQNNHSYHLNKCLFSRAQISTLTDNLRFQMAQLTKNESVVSEKIQHVLSLIESILFNLFNQFNDSILKYLTNLLILVLLNYCGEFVAYDL
ncbi:hypothetical protein BpHYR1_038106 [Brachionus plicatilis]|uniref:Uncharacterized protein n=1 Tax=Brachionus plicatilis TaxID=10195 RepID=A0A3M7Q4M3_BRAPC|nr:hypothetical protein BpHYR1_038106 [Brachionus plicatilis]